MHKQKNPSRGKKQAKRRRKKQESEASEKQAAEKKPKKNALEKKAPEKKAPEKKAPEKKRERDASPEGSPSSSPRQKQQKQKQEPGASAKSKRKSDDTSPRPPARASSDTPKRQARGSSDKSLRSPSPPPPKKNNNNSPGVRQKLIAYAGMDGEQRSTSTVLKEAADRRVTIVQFGGHTSNIAGDAALLRMKNSRRRVVVDVGVGTDSDTQSGALLDALKESKKIDPEDSDASEGEEASVEGEEASDDEDDRSPSAKQLLVITHWHEDHAGKPARWGEGATQLPKALSSKKKKKKNDPGPKLLHGQREPTKNYQATANKMSPREVVKNGEKLFAWRSKPGATKRDGHTGLRVEGRAIVPPEVTLKKTAQNEESLGVVMLVNKYGKGRNDAPERLFTMVSLGDMEGADDAASKGVARTVSAAREKFASGLPIDVVKLSHHGSDKNLPVVPDNLIDNNTTVIISGYTKKDPNKLIAKIKEWNPKHVVMIAQNQATLGDLKSEAWTKLKKKDEGNVIPANNLVMTMDDDGTVAIEATGFG